MGETERFLDALRFLTICPTPPTNTVQEKDWLARALKYFPLVGIGIGAASGAMLLIATPLWGPVIAALLAVGTGAALTGALHEDGLADTFDAFGGGWTRERRLEIMKDSRIGTFGALALGLDLALRVAALAHLPPWPAAFALIAGHAAARATTGPVIHTMSYAGDGAAMKVEYAETPVSSGEFLTVAMCVIVAVFPLSLVSIMAVLSGVLLGAIFAAALALWSRHAIGGYTGDVLGAIEQVFEIGFLLGVAASLR